MQALSILFLFAIPTTPLSNQPTNQSKLQDYLLWPDLPSNALFIYCFMSNNIAYEGCSFSLVSSAIRQKTPDSMHQGGLLSIIE